ncbi:hypothetical protein [Silvibacterium sp.]|uniref:hypothetical protein n=1 Tax=Silvibacterium sp. TaxID=1964179 RepID=UPI0039E72B0E
MRRAVAIPMLLLLLIPVFSGFFGEAAAEASLPACCRRAGKHHCAIMAEMASDGVHRSFSSVREKCPYTPAALSMIVLPSFQPSTAAAIYAGVQQHVSVAAQAEAKRRISFDRARQKRGPPALS